MRRTSALAVAAALSATVLVSNQAWAQPGGVAYLSAGGREVFTGTCAWGPCKRNVGTHTVVGVDDLAIRSTVPDKTYGFGVGHITTADAKNWATYENQGVSTLDGLGRLRVRMVPTCSIDGHEVIGGSFPPQFGPRGRREFQNSYAKWFYHGEESVSSFIAIGLNMTVQAACVAERAGSANDCNVDFLRWQCVLDTNHVGYGPPEFTTDMPLGGPGQYLPFDENVAVADHGFFVRQPGPNASDMANLSFRDNTTYSFGPTDPVEACKLGLCTSQWSGANWIDETNNHSRWTGVDHFDEPSADLLTYDRSADLWRVCLNEGGACGASAACGRRVLAMKPPRCQAQSNLCWAYATQSLIYNEMGRDEDICTIVDWGLGTTNCPNQGGFAWNIQAALQQGGVAVGEYVVTPVSFEEIRDQIDAGNPILFSLKWRNDWTFHSGIIYGYDCSEDGQIVYWFEIVGCGSGGPDGRPAIRRSDDYDLFVTNNRFLWFDTQFIDP